MQEELVKIKTDFGGLLLYFLDRQLVRVEFSDKATDTDLKTYAEHEAVRKLTDYLQGEIHALDNWPISLQGTDFRKRVWSEIAKVKAGSVITYKQLAQKLNSSPRAVAAACGDNPLPVFVGCHRVIGCGNLGGFSHGYDLLPIKVWLLSHEGFKNE